MTEPWLINVIFYIKKKKKRAVKCVQFMDFFSIHIVKQDILPFTYQYTFIFNDTRTFLHQIHTILYT